MTRKAFVPFYLPSLLGVQHYSHIGGRRACNCKMPQEMDRDYLAMQHYSYIASSTPAFAHATPFAYSG
ncbi:hypothetical protein An08g09200, partial [Aspergillus niger]|uniref:Uncharacterized protein n=2 Tax=Aspergillus niger TaxID=5061 RepID=A0AAJ8BZI8_ASPNG